MIRLEDFIAATIACDDTEKAFKLYSDAVAAYGFDRIVYSLITDHPTMGRKAGHGLLASYPEDWLRHYQEHDYGNHDPVPKHAFSVSTPFSWAEMESVRTLSPRSIKVMREAEEAGLNNGVGIPLYGPKGEIAGVGLARSNRDVDTGRQQLYELRTLTAQFHLIYGELQGASPQIEELILTPRERELLLWLSEGKSLSAAADIIGFSHNTAKYHLKNVYGKLGVNERLAAINKAVRYGLITPVTVRGPYPPR